MKPELMVEQSFTCVSDQVNRIIKNKPGDVFTVNMLEEQMSGCKSSIRAAVARLPDAQRVRVKQGSKLVTVFGSAAAVAKFKKLMP